MYINLLGTFKSQVTMDNHGSKINFFANRKSVYFVFLSFSLLKLITIYWIKEMDDSKELPDDLEEEEDDTNEEKILYEG